jgi:DNA-binding transcriptional regulator YhcF (GntR family)
MTLSINKKNPLGIREQIKRQVRLLIDSGEMEQGESLPSARDMAELLKVNRNTVSQAYRELCEEGHVEVIRGSGTYVRQGPPAGHLKGLAPVFEDALQKAKRLGYTAEETVEYFQSRLATLGSTKGRRVLVVECSREAVDDITARLVRDLEVEAQGVVIQDLEENAELAPQNLREKDLVVCGMNHVEEFKRVVPDCEVEVLAVMLKPHMRVVNELLHLPAGSTVGFTCASQRGTETLRVPFSGGSSLKKIWAGFDNPEGLKKMLDQCDVVFATEYVYDRIREMAGQKKRVIRVSINVDEDNVELIREHFAWWEGRLSKGAGRGARTKGEER